MSGNSSASDAIELEVFGLSDVGRARAHNEDAFVVSDLDSSTFTSFSHGIRRPAGPRGDLFMVADGMGGAAAGEIASAMAVETVITELRDKWWRGSSANDPRSFARELRHATETANRRIFQFAAEHAEHRGMGTTATIAGLFNDTLFLSQVGDSRAYLIRSGMVRQLTKDQSLMQRLVEAGELTEEEAERSERRNIILQALGPEPTIRSDITHQQICQGDILLLCSDGLSGQVRAGDIARAAATEHDLERLCRGLVALANDRGGPDNITIVAARFSGAALAAPTELDQVGYTAYSTVSGESDAIADSAFGARIPQPSYEDWLNGSAPESGSSEQANSSAPGEGALQSAAEPDVEMGRSLVYGILFAALVGLAFIVYRTLAAD